MDTKYDMEKHNISIHSWKKPECTICHNRKDGLKVHTETVHKELKHSTVTLPILNLTKKFMKGKKPVNMKKKSFAN
jgi:hypothetical protein